MDEVKGMSQGWLSHISHVQIEQTATRIPAKVLITNSIWGRHALLVLYIYGCGTGLSCVT